MEALSIATVALAAGAVFFAWWTVRLTLKAAREVRTDRITHRIEQIAAAVEAIYESDHPAHPKGIAQDRLQFAMLGLAPELPKTWQLTQLLGFNYGIANGLDLPGIRLSTDKEVSLQCVQARTELELKLSLLFTQIGEVPDPEKWINRPNRWERWKDKHRAKREATTPPAEPA